jgi:hypothetical protein
MTALVDRGFFFANYPTALGKLSPTRKDGFEALFDAWDKLPHLDYLDWLAYAMATAWHETGVTMQPVREGFAKSDADAYAKVTAYCAKQGIENYARRHANGHAYYGRGYVQLTHAYNYQKMGVRLGVGQAFYDDPDKVMQAKIAAEILLIGLMEGAFRPKAGTLIDYFSGTEHDWFNARDLINGDKKKVQAWTLKEWPGGKPTGELIGGYGQVFRKALRVLST